MQQLSDEALVAKFQSDPDLLSQRAIVDELFARYHSRVAAWCLRFTGNRDSAADLAQDIFLKAYRNLYSFRGESKFSTWLFSVARNHSINERRARAERREEAGDSIALELAASKEESVLNALVKQESIEALRVLVDENLDATEKRVMTLHYGEEIKLDAITRLLGLSNASGAKAYIVSARRKLSAALQRSQAREKQRGAQ
jgi:RNA polymerase sigma-70 factor (ECF subfamily)